jgi:CO/xanthine dehydrogenase Mo-binding subunit
MNNGYNQQAGPRYYLGDYLQTLRAFAKAAHVTELRLGDGGIAGSLRQGEFDCDLALDSAGRFLAIRLRGFMSLDAQLTGKERRHVWGDFAAGVAAPYRMPLVEASSTVVAADARSSVAILGAGRLVERLIDRAAHEIKIDPINLRKRNFISPAAGRLVDEIAIAADVARFAERRASSQASGKRLGLGAAYHDNLSKSQLSAGPIGPHIAEVEIDPAASRIAVVRYTTAARFGSAEAEQIFHDGGAGALPAISSAIADAIGGRHIELPATPDRVWQALETPSMLGLY